MAKIEGTQDPANGLSCGMQTAHKLKCCVRHTCILRAYVGHESGKARETRGTRVRNGRNLANFKNSNKNGS